jgi:hypothetical protein
MLPGVELLAHTVRLAPLRTEHTAASAFKLRVAVLAGLLLFAAIGLVFRGLARMAAYVTGGLLLSIGNSNRAIGRVCQPADPPVAPRAHIAPALTSSGSVHLHAIPGFVQCRPDPTQPVTPAP